MDKGDDEHREEHEEEDQEDEDFDDNLAFVQVSATSVSTSAGQPQARSSRQTRQRTAIQLDDDEDVRVEDFDETAGAIIRSGEMVREDWQKHFSQQEEAKRFSKKGKADNPASELWQPFKSELNWQVGSWAINEEVHKSAMDRLLNIPGVRTLALDSPEIDLVC
ncbi:hypothetical protein FOMPIDRAFT_62767 [Fomitopsis schrenkii]|uniref:Uncharacterized protein n=1 Tax=Fomitopsis schrenkii TaxID=2126942 RepID=S8E751_FOMSC|nr:hypothetical protein FOMPIDRAFT_62767 [Fomitopsis schrenkii]